MRGMVGAALIAIVSVAPALAQTAVMTPAQAVAAAAGGADVAGVFEMHVASTGASGFVYYLNSATDYRDAGNLAIVIQPAARNAFLKLGGEPDAVFKDKRIRVKGVARRVPVAGGKHFQTRINVESGDQIEIIG
ncbi:MAG: hypothetical protein KF730_17720 [Sphingomonas sp.]|uniref:hypothetical protein n=1 Tax=Sphingomonas sp. TaxID=28214 RepID=UPI0025E9A493|nr:hypothetical protein [Sphingomonas sp.]MBX3566400.1 hypothetical protein [Sphingomonas sp.]